MAFRKNQAEVELTKLDLAYLGQFVGMRVNERVLESLHAEGFAGLRQGHGFLFQHLVDGPRSIGELTKLMGITQQAVSKSVAELERLGFVSKAPLLDGRFRFVELSSRGVDALERARSLRAEFERRFEKRFGERSVATAKKLLAQALEDLGGVEAVRHRRIKMPR
jgi:DNA-binding MarR family transcriptional regulator